MHKTEAITFLKTCVVFLVLLTAGAVIGQQMPPAPPPPPQFMVMKGFPLSCFEKPTFEEDGLEFFVCNGGGGLTGVRRAADPTHTVLVHDPEIAQNLNMKAARSACGKGRFGVRSDPGGIISFVCQDKEMEFKAKFRASSKADWQKYDKYLIK
jgi:hypothetical protein